MKGGFIHRRGTEDAEFAQSEVTERVLAAAFEVHTVLGAGLLESIYQRALARELHLRGVRFEQQVAIPLAYKGATLDAPLRLDLLVEGAVIVEIKSVLHLDQIHQAQVLTYLRLADLRVGLLINFNVPSLRQGIKRVINIPRTSASSVPLRCMNS
ncbi:MAG: GxxExxY protein [Rubrivivax sp.]